MSVGPVNVRLDTCRLLHAAVEQLNQFFRHDSMHMGARASLETLQGRMEPDGSRVAGVGRCGWSWTETSYGDRC